MQTIIRHTEYKDQQCIELENEFLIVKIIPQSGAKIQSIISKETNAEYLSQSDNSKFRVSEYGTSWGEGDMSGIDEMFPSIIECFYPQYPWKGTPIPCHGEIWAIPWSYAIEGSMVLFTVNGVRFPYTIEKRVELDGNCLKQHYTAYNNSSFDFKYIWATHPLFVCDENTEIVFHESVDEIINVYSQSSAMSGYGSVYNWPVMIDKNGNRRDMSKILPRDSRQAEKYYVRNQMTEGYCALKYKDKGMLEINYPCDKLPYLGVWVNQGYLLDQYNVALEPCTSGFDRLDVCPEWGRECNLDANDRNEWYLNIKINNLSEGNK